MTNNQKQFGLAMHAYHDAADFFEFAITVGTSDNAARGGPHVKVFSGSDAAAPADDFATLVEPEEVALLLPAIEAAHEAADGSTHSGGAHFLRGDGPVHDAMGDGSVRFISESIDLI